MADGPPDNVVPYTDQALFLALRGAGEEAVMQIVWIYEHPVDLDALRRFHENFGHGLVARRIERSPLPFGRHRWVSSPGPATAIDFAPGERPRAELFDWADEHVQLPIDPEWGPGWRIGVCRFTDSTTAISVVMSHCVADGGGFIGTVVDTINGKTRDLGYPPPGSRSRRRALAADMRQIVTDAPEVGRTLVKAAKVAMARRGEVLQKRVAPQPSSGGGAKHQVIVPALAVYIDIAEWDTRAKALGGNSHSLLAGFAAKIAENMGRIRASDGAVTLMIPVDERIDATDTRGNVVSIANVSLDPTVLTKDLSAARAAIKQGIKTAREVPDEMIELLPLIPFLPKRALAKTVDMTFGFSDDVPVSCSNLGDLAPELLQIDGTPAEYICLRGVDRYVTREGLERKHGMLTLLAGRVADRIGITVIGYQPGIENSKPRLRELIAQTLAEFELTGLID